MNTTTESKRSVEYYKTRFPKLIAGSASKLGMALMAVGFFLAIACAKAETAISMADTNFILAAAQTTLSNQLRQSPHSRSFQFSL